MTNPTDPRVEAAFRAAWNEPCLLGDPIACHALDDAIPKEGETQTDAMKAVIRRMVSAALKAADAAAWNTDIKEAPGQRSTIMVQLKSGRVTFANNEFPQGEDGWVDLLWPADGQDISETNIVAWRLIPHYQMPEAKP